MLGRIRIAVGNDFRSVGTYKMEILLRTLLIRNGRVVPITGLTEELWGKKPPDRAVASLHVYVSQLRKILNRFSKNNDVIITRPPGYVLNLGRDELDLDLFLALSEKGRLQISTNEHAEAVVTLTEALRLWREPLEASAYEGPIIREFANWAEELRIECVELLARSLLASDQPNEAIRILNSLVSEYALRENLYALLMQALGRVGRRADALEVYRIARNRIRDELGLEPCRLLQETQELILNDKLDELVLKRSRPDGRMSTHAIYYVAKHGT